jgi:hypothetical protein
MEPNKCQCLACLGYTVDAETKRLWEKAIFDAPTLTLEQIKHALDILDKAYDAHGKLDVEVK